VPTRPIDARARRATSSRYDRRALIVFGAALGEFAPRLVVEPTSITGQKKEFGVPIRGSASEIADGFRAFQAGGVIQLEVILWPPTPAALDAILPVLELPDAA